MRCAEGNVGDAALDVSVLVVASENIARVDASIGGALHSIGKLRGEILLINCSRDDADNFVARKFPAVRVLPRAGNLGFGRGNNHLAAHARGAYILLLNPDTAPKSDEIARLVAFARAHPHAGICGGRCVTPDGAVDHGSHQPMLSPCGILLSAVGLTKLRAGALPYRAVAPQQVTVISGAFLLIRADVWREVGGFDERFFMYAEEVNLCARVAQLGYEIWSDPSIVMIHDAGSGAPESTSRRCNTLRGNATFVRKHHGPIAAECACVSMVLHEVIRLLYAHTPLRVRDAVRARQQRKRCREVLAARSVWFKGWPAGMRFE